ncbi:glutamyl-tRNA reductase, partial [uncultured Megasphaera sp.]|uniref:glutamyl-tRNA reductase n=1 Tax=uncultured Megasphaera sp. TaxID=165188 RepID=UPI0025D39550
MDLVILGLNHKTVPVAIREQFTMTPEAIHASLQRLDDYPGLREAVILSTCNRAEIYAVVDDIRDNEQALYDFFLDTAGRPQAEPSYFYSYKGKACIHHLFDVAASLDSLVLGEGQILSQVKQAYIMAHENGATSAILNMLFQQAIATGKRVRTETHIAYNAVSVSYTAVQMAEKALGSLAGKNLLLYGAGQMARLTAQNFLGKGAGKLYIINRHLERAQELADDVGGQAVHYKDADSVVRDVDIIIASTGAPHYVISVPRLRRFQELRRDRPLLLIDIAVPRDVDPAVTHLPNVTLYNIDDLEEVVHDNEATRQREAVAASYIVDAAVKDMVDRYQYL